MQIVWSLKKRRVLDLTDFMMNIALLNVINTFYIGLGKDMFACVIFIDNNSLEKSLMCNFQDNFCYKSLKIPRLC